LEAELTSNWWKVKWNEITIINASERSLEASRQLQTQYEIDESIERQKNKSKLLTVNYEAAGKTANQSQLFMPRKGMYKVSQLILFSKLTVILLKFYKILSIIECFSFFFLIQNLF